MEVWLHAWSPSNIIWYIFQTGWKSKHKVLTRITFTVRLYRCGPITRYWRMKLHNYFKDLAHRIKQFKNIAKSLSHCHQQLVCYQLSKPESLVKRPETAKCNYKLLCTVLASTLIGQTCNVNEFGVQWIFSTSLPISKWRIWNTQICIPYSRLFLDQKFLNSSP